MDIPKVADPINAVERKPIKIGDRYFVEILSYGLVNPSGHSLMATKEHFKGRKDLKVLEIGVCRGNNAEKIYLELEPELLVLVDPWKLDQTCLYHHDNNWAETYYRVQGKPEIIIIKALSKMASEMLNLTFDFIYIDGAHWDITTDLYAWWPKMNKGGVFAGHDYNYDNIMEAVDKFFEERSIELHSSPYHPDGGRDWWVFT